MCCIIDLSCQILCPSNFPLFFAPCQKAFLNCLILHLSGKEKADTLRNAAADFEGTEVNRSG